MYVLLGSNGNITSKAAQLLRAQGEEVRVVGRRAGPGIVAGDIADEAFLTRAFAGARAVYVMIPPDYAAPDMGRRQDQLGEAIARAVRASGVKKVVNLSSIGAHLPSGTGPIAALHRQELRLNALEGVDVLHLRPGYFFENAFHALGAIEALGVYPDMTAPDAPIPMVATADIASVVARELRRPTAPGKRVLHLHAKKLYTMRETATIVGAALGKPALAYVQAPAADVKAALMQHGFSASAAGAFEEMADAFTAGRLNGEYEKGPTEITPTPYDAWAAAALKPARAAVPA